MLCGQNTSSDDIRLTVDVELTELLGSEKIAYFSIGENKCSAKLPADYELGEKLDLSIKKEDIYLFDKKNGCRIK